MNNMDINRILPECLKRWLPTMRDLNPKEQIRDMITALVLVFKGLLKNAEATHLF